MRINISDGSIGYESIKSKNNANPENILNLNIYKKILPNKKGENVKVSLIDTGYPNNRYIIKAKEDTVDCTEGTKEGLIDRYGHATYTGSIFKRFSQDSYGIAPMCDLSYLKVMDGHQISYSSLITAILWSIGMKMDIICLPLSANYDYLLLKNVIKKAVENNICIIAPIDSKNAYPGIYEGVYSIGKIKSANKRISKNCNFEFQIKEKEYRSGISLYCALYSAVAAKYIQKYKEDKKEYSVYDIYEKLDVI
jgi:hypothetical protein